MIIPRVLNFLLSQTWNESTSKATTLITIIQETGYCHLVARNKRRVCHPGTNRHATLFNNDLTNKKVLLRDRKRHIK